MAICPSNTPYLAHESRCSYLGNAMAATVMKEPLYDPKNEKILT